MNKHRYAYGVLLFAAGVTLIQLLVTVFAYARLPNTIPAFVDVWGTPVRVMQKSVLAAARFPLMSVLLLVICALMFYAKDANGKTQQTLRPMWGTVAMISSIKMTATTLEMVFPAAQGPLRIIALCFAASGVVVIVLSLVRLYKRDNGFVKHMMAKMDAKRFMIVGVLLLSYALVAMAPLLL